MKFKIDKQAFVFSAILAVVSTLVSVVLTVISVVYSTIEPTQLVANLWVALPIAIGVPPLVAIPIGYKTYIQKRLLTIANEKLSNLIRYDQLTGLLSRATFFDEVETMQAQKRDDKRYDAVFFMDLDHFKNINDQHGHAAGDEVLRNFGALVNRQLRQGDLAGRLGGEEFAIFLADCAPDEAKDRAEHLSESFGDQAINIGETEIRCTVSIGVFVENGRVDLDAMLSQADELLYKAKQTGRNRVVSGEISRLAA